MNANDLGKLVLRLTLSGLLLFHGISKIVGGIGPIAGMASKVGMPPAFAYLVYVGEVVAPLMILFGVWTRIAAAIVVVNMIVAVMLVHTTQFFTLSRTGGWALELQGFYFMVAIALILFGAGRYSVAGESGRWN
jgi:putative oxidoreductase